MTKKNKWHEVTFVNWDNILSAKRMWRPIGPPACWNCYCFIILHWCDVEPCQASFIAWDTSKFLQQFSGFVREISKFLWDDSVLQRPRQAVKYCLTAFENFSDLAMNVKQPKQETFLLYESTYIRMRCFWQHCDSQYNCLKEVVNVSVSASLKHVVGRLCNVNEITRLHLCRCSYGTLIQNDKSNKCKRVCYDKIWRMATGVRNVTQDMWHAENKHKGVCASTKHNIERNQACWRNIKTKFTSEQIRI